MLFIILLLQEAKPYKNDSEIIAMTNLVNAYQSSDIEQFQSILRENNEAIMEVQSHLLPYLDT